MGSESACQEDTRVPPPTLSPPRRVGGRGRGQSAICHVLVSGHDDDHIGRGKVRVTERVRESQWPKEAAPWEVLQSGHALETTTPQPGPQTPVDRIK